MTVLELLEKARERISGPGAWCRCNYAQNKKGHSVTPDDPGAVAFCARGALSSFNPDGTIYREARDLLDEAARRRGHYSSLETNDRLGATQEEVLSLYDDAIGSAR